MHGKRLLFFDLRAPPPVRFARRRSAPPDVPWLVIILMSLVVVFAPAVAHAQPKTDVVRLANGDRITGEVKKLERGQLELSTDDEGTIEIEWDKIVALESKAHYDVGMQDGSRFFGSLESGDPRVLVIVESTGRVLLPMADVTLIAPIGSTFWRRLDGSLDFGFSYTHSSRIAQLNLSSYTVYRRPAFEARLNASGTLTQNGQDNSHDDRGIIQASYIRFRGQRLFVSAGAGFETNESLGLVLRSQVAVAAGPRLVNTNRAQMSIGAGIAANEERSLGVEPRTNLEGIVAFRQSYYSYDRPKTNVDIGFQYYPSFSDWGRQRMQLDASAKREFWKDVYISITLYDTFDSRPPAAGAAHNDVGVVLSFGWSY
jgi:hypothetical protein